MSTQISGTYIVSAHTDWQGRTLTLRPHPDPLQTKNSEVTIHGEVIALVE